MAAGSWSNPRGGQACAVDRPGYWAAMTAAVASAVPGLPPRKKTPTPWRAAWADRE